MIMKKNGYITILTILAISILTTGTLFFNANKKNKTNYSNFETKTSSNEDLKNEDREFNKKFPIIDEKTGISPKNVFATKNKDIEVTLNPNGYTPEELVAEILPTTVRIHNTLYGKKYFFNGNVYDIDDDYIYILTCRHGFVDEKMPSNEELNENNYFRKIAFFNDVSITPTSYKVFIAKNLDIALIVLDKNEIPQDTLIQLKSVNLNNLYSINPYKTNNYLIAYTNSDKHYECSQIEFVESSCTYALEYNKFIYIKDGWSGSGVFDAYGNYTAMTSNLSNFAYYNIPSAIYQIMKEISETPIT